MKNIFKKLYERYFLSAEAYARRQGVAIEKNA